jgi:hypothetical protein
MVFYHVYTAYLGEMGIPSWILPYSFYAFLTAFFGFIFRIVTFRIRDYRESRKMNVQRRITDICLRKTACETSINEIRNCINRVNAEDYPLISLITIQPNLSMELQGKVKEFKEHYELCRDLHIAAEYVIPQIIQGIIKSDLPETFKTGYDLASYLKASKLIKRYINGEEVNVTWLKNNEPQLLAGILANLKDSETQLDMFFLSLNNSFKSIAVLNRYRIEKKKLVEFGEQIIDYLKSELKSLDEELSCLKR